MKAEVYFSSRPDDQDRTPAGDPRRLVDVGYWCREPLDRLERDHRAVRALGSIKGNLFTARHVADFQSEVIDGCLPFFADQKARLVAERAALAAAGPDLRNHDHLIEQLGERMRMIRETLDGFLDEFAEACRSTTDLSAQMARIDIKRDLSGHAAPSVAAGAMRM